MANEIIMYDSPEAAEPVTLTGWVNKGKDGRFWYKDEHMARWAGCSHLKCECGNVMEKSWTKCKECRHKSAVERYNKLEFKEWDGTFPVCTWDGDKYFFDEDSLTDYMVEDEDEPMKEIDLLYCEPIFYHNINADDYCDEAHEDWEPEQELKDAAKAFNEVISKLPPHSYNAGKTRTKYILSEQS